MERATNTYVEEYVTSTCDVSRVPGDGALPYNIRENADEPHRQICVEEGRDVRRAEARQQHSDLMEAWRDGEANMGMSGAGNT
ncbi:hypothetical protein E2C01_019161 [Portunus trituberculatus]|uniref:Uncharacterized protein n=1 Tax=Portunus trituberculatus TaxID=210409 RepID=A0A5B7DWJ2_PORTR|nr:hypothetical protein [Portunus trituberculatus]